MHPHSLKFIPSYINLKKKILKVADFVANYSVLKEFVRSMPSCLVILRMGREYNIFMLKHALSPNAHDHIVFIFCNFL